MITICFAIRKQGSSLFLYSSRTQHLMFGANCSCTHVHSKCYHTQQFCGGYKIPSQLCIAYKSRYQHVDPYDAIQIHRDLKAKISIAIHCCTFSLTLEPMDEPPKILQEEMVCLYYCSRNSVCPLHLLYSLCTSRCICIVSTMCVCSGQREGFINFLHTEAWWSSQDQGWEAHKQA